MLLVVTASEPPKSSAGGFVVAGLVHDIKDGIALAAEQVDSGRALQKLRALQGYDATASR